MTSMLLTATARLCYEPICQQHAAELEHALCDPRVYTFIDAPCPTVAGLHASFARKEVGAPAQRSDERWLDYAVRHIESGEAIGRLEATIIGRHAEVAYLFGPVFWGRGYATEGLEWLHELLSRSFGVAEFWATVAPSNTRSIRLLERAGYGEAPSETWPRLTSYDPGDRVFRRSANA
jgi:RimJ/RimL family protein N-acetyltransferase